MTSPAAKYSNKNIRFAFYGLWLLFALLSAFFTELLNDEAYYWKFSRHLDWGYFDHPPTIAFFIKLGYSIFQNELGVRLFSILSIMLGILGLEKLCEAKDLLLFYSIVASIAILHFIGILALPDTPLLCLSIAFFLLYRSFLTEASLLKSMLLGLTIALMLLSKYHGILIVGFVVLSNLKLLKQKYFWTTVLFALICFSPHLIWQAQNDFPTFKYHLIERSSSAYKITDTLEYIVSQLFVLGPITGILFFITSFKSKAINDFEKGLKWMFWGVFIFFFVMSLKGRVEAHWTLIALIPGVYFCYKYASQHVNLKKAFRIILPISLILIFSARFFIALDVLPKNKATAFIQHYHNWEEWALKVKEQANGKPVVFISTYKRQGATNFMLVKQPPFLTTFLDVKINTTFGIMKTV